MRSPRDGPLFAGLVGVASCARHVRPSATPACIPVADDANVLRGARSAPIHAPAFRGARARRGGEQQPAIVLGGRSPALRKGWQGGRCPRMRLRSPVCGGTLSPATTIYGVAWQARRIDCPRRVALSLPGADGELLPTWG